jgi:hypothetical protein
MTNKSAPMQRQRQQRYALIQKPLKAIKNKAPAEYQNARYAADRGNGELVKRIARS